MLRPCMVRLPGCCNHNAETTVLAHFRLNGMDYEDGKPDDLLGAWACSACHEYVDTHKDDQTQLWFAHGVLRTIARIRKEKVKL